MTPRERKLYARFLWRFRTVRKLADCARRAAEDGVLTPRDLQALVDSVPTLLGVDHETAAYFEMRPVPVVYRMMAHDLAFLQHQWQEVARIAEQRSR